MKRVVLPKADQAGDDVAGSADPHPVQSVQRRIERGTEDAESARDVGPRTILPPEIMEIMVPSLKVGAGAGKLFPNRNMLRVVRRC